MNPMLAPTGQTVTLIRKLPRLVGGSQVIDAYGALVYDEASQVLSQVAIWPESATETLPPEHRSHSVYVMAIPPGIAVDSIDRVVWQGKSWEVQGEAEGYNSPFTGSSLQVLRIHRSEG